MTREEAKKIFCELSFFGKAPCKKEELEDLCKIVLTALEQQAILDKTKEVVAKWKSDNFTDGFAWNCMKEIADIVDKGESEE